MADDFIAHLQDLFAPLGRVQARSMFGGHGLYFDGLMFAIVLDGALYLKVDEQTRPAFSAAGCHPFVYMGQKKPIEMSYWSVPEEAMETAQDMRPWAQRAMGAALRKANAPKAKRGAKAAKTISPGKAPAKKSIKKASTKQAVKPKK